MTRWILLAVLVVVISAAVPVALSLLPADSTSHGVTLHSVRSDGKPTGKVYVEGETLYNFGKMAQRDDGSHQWVIKNVGEGDLELSGGSSTCMCTVATFEKGPNDEERKSLVLKPGQSTPIKVTWHTKDTNGPFEKSASILTNDPERQEVWFTISGVVQPALTTQPADPTFDFSSIPSEEPTQGRLAISSPDKPDFQILSITSTRPESVNATYRPLNNEEKAQLNYDNGYRVDIEVKPSPILGVFSEEILIVTDHPRQKELRVPVSGRRVGPISATPETIRMTASNQTGGTRSSILWVRGQESTRFEVASKPENLQVEITPAEETATDAKVRKYRLTATIPPGTSPGVITGFVVLKTDHPNAGEMKLPVNITVEGQ